MTELAEMFLRQTRRKIPKGKYNHFLETPGLARQDLQIQDKRE